MLWSLFKILVFVAAVVALAFGARWLLSVSGEVLITFAGSEYVLSPIMVILGLLVLMLALWIVFKLVGLLISVLRFINGDDTAISRYFDRNRERKGYEALSESLIALASGESREAAAKAQKAEKYLQKPEVTDVLVAQAAEAAGERQTATDAYKRLVTRDRTRFVGVRGLMRQKLEEGDTATAMKLAEKAFALKPRHVETQDTLLRLQARDENWEGARKVLSAKLKSGALPKDVYKRREAVLSLADAREALAKGEASKARAEALEANRLSPELIPAAVLAARMHIESGEKRRATKVLKAAWQKTHHPDLAAAFADIEPGETPSARIKRFEPFLKLDPEAPESRLLNAELHLAAEDFPGARRALGKLAETHPTARSLSLMAAIERGEGASEAIVRGWLAKALGASRGPQWVCDNCGTVHGSWVPVCTSCEAFDSLSWTEPRQSETTVEALPSEVVPLLVGPSRNEVVAPVPPSAVAEHDPSPEPAPPEPVVDAEPAPDEKRKVSVEDADEVVTLPAGESPPAPQDEAPTTGGTSRM
ncbi:heme biosynthesis protein HemY [Jannaschia aquimarina]|uniref:Tetratricopeptide repeat protein n=1 Tax=Jannaschia aquimarina TaxID=935700 RepID=A0A0D1D5Z4_9RHOB|nr:heme biosynthesis HemY N-terminal domain-containing protein [Jannaschia aquimarina]KIT15398.1 tetratricopeptide repeat protein [Jannaschia aquimarina]SNT22879.1 HemY protein [Jannaschia aquimarina]